jgi:FMN phosphatase YigB (HAD superfamily)
LAGFGVEAEPDCDLLEWNYGQYEGRRTKDIHEERPGWQLFRDGCPGGEAPNQVGARADRIVERVRNVPGNVLLFSSGHFLRVLAARWLGLDAEAGRLFTLDTASLSILGYEHDQSEPAIRLWNDTGTSKVGSHQPSRTKIEAPVGVPCVLGAHAEHIAESCVRVRPMNQVVFLVDVDNTLLDNDHIQADIKAHLERQYGAACRDRYWAILDDLFVELGYRDYLGALQRYRVEHPQDMHLLSMSSFLVDYPFANRLYPGSLDVLERLRQWGPTVLLTDGDVVFQPRKVERSGLSEAVNSHVLIYIHKELALDDVESRYPALHYVLVDDKPRILAAVKDAWGSRVTTVFPRQGQYAHDAKALASFATPDVTVDRIGDLLDCDLGSLLMERARLEAVRR